MMRPTWKYLLCLWLAPILIAQELNPKSSTAMARASAHDAGGTASSITVPEGTPLTLVSLDSVYPSVVKVGSGVRFIDGTIVIPAGEPVTGVVTKAKRARSDSGKGRLEIRINSIQIGTDVNVRLRDSNPKSHQGPLGMIKDEVEWVGACIIYLPLCLVIEANAHQGAREDYGLDFLPDCDVLQFWTKAQVIIPTTQIPSPRPDGVAEIRGQLSR